MNDIWDKLEEIMEAGRTGGDHSGIDLSPDNYGSIVLHNHEECDGRIIYKSISDWIIDLNKELNTLNFEEWDFDKCQQIM
jgi:hypothetical protein